MEKLRTFLLIYIISIFQLISQNQLPIQNGEMEDTENGFFSNWQTQANNEIGEDMQYHNIEYPNLIQTPSC